jgi:hypothetical protein
MKTADIVRTYFDLPKTEDPYVEIPNSDRVEFAKFLRFAGLFKGVEIGTERGMYAEELCLRNPNIELFCVDPWMAYKGYREHVSQERLDGFYEETKQRLEQFNAVLIRKFSVEAAEDFADESLDFIYIDGNHSLLHVVQDLWYWVPKVRKDGIIAGHDYIRRKNKEYLMHVIPGVHAYMDAMDYRQLFVIGKKRSKPGELRDSTRSWFFIK